MLLENNPYPQDYRVRREAKALVRAGYQVSVISPRVNRQPVREVLDGVFVCRYPSPPVSRGFLGYIWEYSYSMVAAFLLSLYIFLTKGFDLIHAHNPPDTFAFIILGYKLLGKRFIFDHHDLSPEMYDAQRNGAGNAIIRRLLLFFEKVSFRLANHVVTTNQSYRDIALGRGGVKPENITIVRNGPELDRSVPVEPDPGLRARASTVIGYVGVMGYQDGVDYLLRALSHLKNDLGRKDFYTVIIGRGDAVPDLKALTTRLDLDSHVWFTGYIPLADLIRYLSTADLCVVPDPSNPFNDRSTMIKITEYLAFGKPVVAFDLPEHRVTAQSAALYARPNDELDFARKIAELMDAPEKRQQMGKFGRDRVETTLAWNCQEPNILLAYEKVLQQRT